MEFMRPIGADGHVLVLNYPLSSCLLSTWKRCDPQSFLEFFLVISTRFGTHDNLG